MSGQLRFFQVTTVLLLLLLAGSAGYYIYRQHLDQPVAVLVDNRPVCTVESIAAAKELISQVHARQVGPEYLTQDDPRFKEDVEFQRVSGQVAIDSLDAAADKLATAAHTIVDADVVVVNKKPVVALPDASTAQAAVDALRQHYVSMPPDDPVEEKPMFVQIVTIDRRTVPSTLTKRTAEDGARALWTPPPPLSYTVEPHETGWLIARKFKMTFSDFLRANAGNDVNRLMPGDTVNISKAFPPVDVIVKKKSQVNQSFAGSGLRQLTLVSTYLDGVELGEPVATSMLTVQRATPRSTLD